MSRILTPKMVQLKATEQSNYEKSKELRAKLNDIEKQRMEVLKEIRSTCTHKFLDGSSAWEGRYAYSFCTICGYDDL